MARQSPSLAAIKTLQAKYGSANFASWQTLRKQFYSYVAYPTAGANQLTFFGDTVSGTVNRQFTNMPKAGSFGQNHFIIKGVRCAYWINTLNLAAFASTDATTLYSELTAGLFQAGYLRLSIGSRNMIELPVPFLYAPPADGRYEARAAGVRSITLTEGTPNTLLTYDSHAPFVDLNRDSKALYRVDPNVLIEAEQNFLVTLEYPTGLIPITASTIVGTNTTLYLGVVLDGIQIRPTQ